jgi:hypothetical protein
MKWFKLLFPIINMFIQINDDGTGPDTISKNNQKLTRKQFNKIRTNRKL